MEEGQRAITNGVLAHPMNAAPRRRCADDRTGADGRQDRRLGVALFG